MNMSERKLSANLWIPLTGIQAGRGGSVVRALTSHQYGSGSIPWLGVICGMSLLFVLVLALRGFSPGTPVLTSPQKPTSNSIWRVSPIRALRLIHCYTKIIKGIIFYFSLIEAVENAVFDSSNLTLRKQSRKLSRFSVRSLSFPPVRSSRSDSWKKFD